MAKRPDVQARIETYKGLCTQEGPDAVLAATRKALGDRHRLMVARAAELAGERLLYDLEPDLLVAYERFLDDPASRDPGCTAKGAIARALVALDCQSVDFFLAGIRYRQPEPVWGGSVDTAVDLRISCAMGLAATSYPRAPIHLVELLHDPEPHCRSGAARAIACTQPLTAEAILRAKALSGDDESEVTGECLASLVQVAGEEALDFVARFLDAADPDLAGLAALALGESHLEEALQILRGRWDAEPLKRERERVLLRAAALHRSPRALDWLVDVAGIGDRASAELAIAELGNYRLNAGLRRRLAAALAERGDTRLVEAFQRSFSDPASGPRPSSGDPRPDSAGDQL